jgi:hypothetical protein
MALAAGAALLILASAAVPTVSASSPPKATCHLSEADWSWAQRALQAWRMTAKDITGIGVVPDFKVVLFDAACVAASDDALNAAEAAWTFTPHAGTIELPGREAVPARVTSFTAAEDKGAVLVMSTPSVWQASGVKSEELGLETMMVAVLLHEGSHVVHAATYGKQVTVLADRHGLPESFNDDSLQGRFKDDEAFASSVQRETELFHQAAAAPDDATARRLARAARDSMRQRATRHYVGADAYWTQAEDLWLTFEGAGQWVGYQWLIHPRGAGLTREIVMPGFAQRSRWWSQKEGLALFLALDRIAGPSWRAVVFGSGKKTALQMLDEALAETP